MKALVKVGVVGATGFEPVTSSVSAKHREPLCYTPFPQVGFDRRRARETLSFGKPTLPLLQASLNLQRSPVIVWGRAPASMHRPRSRRLISQPDPNPGTPQDQRGCQAPFGRLSRQRGDLEPRVCGESRRFVSSNRHRGVKSLLPMTSIRTGMSLPSTPKGSLAPGVGSSDLPKYGSRVRSVGDRRHVPEVTTVIARLRRCRHPRRINYRCRRRLQTSARRECITMILLTATTTAIIPRWSSIGEGDQPQPVPSPRHRFTTQRHGRPDDER